MRRARLLAILAFAAVVAAGCSDSNPFSPPPLTELPAGVEVVTTASGLQYADLRAGSGATAASGQFVTVHYTGWLTDGTAFDSSLDGSPIRFNLGARQVIRGWDEGIVGMKVGGKRRLIIPPALGYGAAGSPPVIPGNATLVFDVELRAIN